MTQGRFITLEGIEGGATGRRWRFLQEFLRNDVADRIVVRKLLAQDAHAEFRFHVVRIERQGQECSSFDF